jgi:hypothetical protein
MIVCESLGDDKIATKLLSSKQVSEEEKEEDLLMK